MTAHQLSHPGDPVGTQVSAADMTARAAAPAAPAASSAVVAAGLRKSYGPLRMTSGRSRVRPG
jgi:hypothetical protein